MKKIFIEDGLSLYNKTGIGQYALFVAKISHNLGYEVIMPRKRFLEKIKNASLKRILYVLWLNTVFPFLLIFSGAEKVIFSNYLTPIYKIPTKKYYPVIHDLWAIKFPETMSNTKRDYQTWILKIVKNTFYKIITVSNTVKKEIIDYYNCPENNIIVTFSYFSFGENPQINLPIGEQIDLFNKFDLKSKQYILSVGSLNKRKNIQMLIDAYNQLDTDCKLVIVGQKENAELSNANKNVIFTGYLSDEELKVIYKNALIFVFPSIYEGFGLPLIDAQNFGVPVICSDIPVFREIGGDSVEYFDLTVEDLSNKIKNLIESNELKKQLISFGNENVKRFLINKLQNNFETSLNCDLEYI